MSRIKYNNSVLSMNHQYLDYKKPVTVFIKITSNCMLNCSFCSQGKSYNNEIDFKFAKNLLKKLKKNGVLRIFYTGGEPFLYSKFREILEYGKELGFCQLVISNGYLLNNSKIKDLLKHLDGISISIHGNELTHNKIVQNDTCYQKVIKNIEIIKKEYPKLIIDICYTATEYNSNEENLLSIANYCRTNDLKLTITRAYKIGNEANNSNFDYIHKLMKNIDNLKRKNYNIEIGHCLSPCSIDYKYRYMCSKCTAGIDFCAIDIDGNIKICSNAKQVIGNIKNQSLKKIWRRNQKILTKHIKRLPLKCYNCDSFKNCIGGCKCETGKIEDGLSDLLAFTINEKLWNNIKKYKFIPQIAIIKKIGINKYQLIGKKICIINKKTYNIIRKIDYSLTLDENQKKHNELKNLFIMLYNDEFIKRDKNA